jgi:hypothetical protein
MYIMCIYKYVYEYEYICIYVKRDYIWYGQNEVFIHGIPLCVCIYMNPYICTFEYDYIDICVSISTYIL